MGRGTDVAREPADLVLRDDALGTIVTAIEQGRVLFANLRTFVVYLLSCNLSEVLVVGLAALSGLPLPILPLQILYLDLITDVFPAFALGLGEGAADVMDHPPRRPGTPVVVRGGWLSIAVYGVAIMSATLAAFGLALSWLALDYGVLVPQWDRIATSRPYPPGEASPGDATEITRLRPWHRHCPILLLVSLDAAGR